MGVTFDAIAIRAMGFWSKAAKASTPAKGKSLFGGDNPTKAGGLLAGIFQAGEAPRRGTRELLQAYKTLPWLRAVSHRIASDVSSVPITLNRVKTSRGKRTKLALTGSTGTVRRALVRRALEDGDFEAVEDHPFLDMMAKLNPAIRAAQTRQITQVWQDLKGDGFWVLERAKDGLPCEAWPVPPHWCRFTPTARDPFFKFQWLSWTRSVPEADVVWWRNPDPENPYGRGSGIAESLADELDIDEYAARHIKSFFFNRAMPDVFVSMEGLESEEQAIQFEERIRRKHQGVGKGFQMHVTNTKADVQEVGQTFKEMQVADLRGAMRDTFIQVFGVPPEVLGIIENSNRSTIDAADYLYAKGVLCPRLDFFVDTLQPLAEEWDPTLVVGYVSPIQEDRAFTLTAMSAQPWAYSQNEHRKVAGAPPVDGGDDVYPPMPGFFGPPLAPALPPGDEPSPKEPGGGGGGKEPATPPDSDDEDEPAPEEEAKAIRAGLGPEGVDFLLEKLRPERLTDEAEPVWRREIQLWGQGVLNRLDVNVSFNMRNPLIREHMEEFSTKKIRGLVHETTRAELRATLIEGVYAGEGVRELQKRVEDTFDAADKHRAGVIARTEVVGSANAANLSAYDQSGVIGGKEWIATPDENTRDSHRSMDGQLRALPADFDSPTGASGAAPGQFGVAAEDVNCRCTIGPRRDAPDSKAFDMANMTAEEKLAEWKLFDAGLSRWEREAEEAFSRGFRKQKQDVVDALNE